MNKQPVMFDRQQPRHLRDLPFADEDDAFSWKDVLVFIGCVLATALVFVLY